MASEAEIQFVVDAIIDAGFDAQTWPAFVVRSKLVTELEALESEQRNLQAAEDAQNQTFGDALVASQAAITEKQAEIDQL